VVLNGKTVLSFNYNYLIHDGSLGLLARNGTASFDNVLIQGDDVAYAGGGSPQLAPAPAPASANAGSPLTGDQLAQIVGAAIQRWAASPVLHGDDSALRQASFVVADLPGLMVGQTVGNSIVIDPTAAGYGWYVDPTPFDDSEFATASPGVLQADSASPAFGRLDLLTVVMHELGHLAGKQDINNEVNPADLMDATLAAGVRRLPEGSTIAVGDSESGAFVLTTQPPSILLNRASASPATATGPIHSNDRSVGGVILGGTLRNTLLGVVSQIHFSGGPVADLLLGGRPTLLEHADSVQVPAATWERFETGAPRLSGLGAAGVDGVFAAPSATALDNSTVDSLFGDRGQGRFWAFFGDTVDPE
jgi:hypothetical protein